MPRPVVTGKSANRPRLGYRPSFVSSCQTRQRRPIPVAKFTPFMIGVERATDTHATGWRWVSVALDPCKATIAAHSTLNQRIVKLLPFGRRNSHSHLFINADTEPLPNNRFGRGTLPKLKTQYFSPDKLLNRLNLVLGCTKMPTGPRRLPVCA